MRAGWITPPFRFEVPIGRSRMSGPPNYGRLVLTKQVLLEVL
jgi:hypothetical protein